MKQIFCVTDPSIDYNVFYTDEVVAAFADLIVNTDCVPFLHLVHDDRVYGHYRAVFQPMMVQALRVLHARWKENELAFKIPEAIFVQYGNWYVEGCVGEWNTTPKPAPGAPVDAPSYTPVNTPTDPALMPPYNVVCACGKDQLTPETVQRFMKR